MSKTFEERRMLLLRHELGHWLVARHHGFKVGGIEVMVMFGQDNLYHPYGSSKVFPEPSLTSGNHLKDELITYLVHRMQVLYAGTIAQTIHIDPLYDSERLDVLKTHGASDLRAVHELMPMLWGLNQESPEDGQTKVDRIDVIIKKGLDDTHLVVAGFKEKLFWMADRLAPKVPRTGEFFTIKLEDLVRLEREFHIEFSSSNRLEIA